MEARCGVEAHDKGIQRWWVTQALVMWGVDELAAMRLLDTPSTCCRISCCSERVLPTPSHAMLHHAPPWSTMPRGSRRIELELRWKSFQLSRTLRKQVSRCIKYFQYCMHLHAQLLQGTARLCPVYTSSFSLSPSLALHCDDVDAIRISIAAQKKRNCTACILIHATQCHLSNWFLSFPFSLV